LRPEHEGRGGEFMTKIYNIHPSSSTLPCVYWTTVWV
jgi:hypothetical protein